MNIQQNRLVLFLLALVLILVSSLSLFIGPKGWSVAYEPALFDYRLNRIILAIIAGSSLAASGASLQSIFRNPLADPHIFGISGGAALGACLMIAFEIDFWFSPSFGAIIGGLIAFLLIFYYLYRSPFESLSGCLLVGILINSIAAAIISLVKVLSPAHKTYSLLYWLIGHINAVENNKLLLIIIIWLIGLIILLAIRHELEILSFGQVESRIIGLNYKLIIRLAVLANCLLIGNTVAFAGMIGFIGLVIPNLLRLIIFPDLRIILPIASFFGAITLVFFDSLSRLSFLFFATELPVGVLTALFLSPVLFYITIGSKYEL